MPLVSPLTIMIEAISLRTFWNQRQNFYACRGRVLWWNYVMIPKGLKVFQVSKVVWKLLSVKHVELAHIKLYQSSLFLLRRTSRATRLIHSNVDSFMHNCKPLGLTDVELFSPSDVVEKRYIQNICMCIPSFSNHAISLNTNVPTLYIVPCLVATPKDKHRFRLIAVHCCTILWFC